MIGLQVENWCSGCDHVGESSGAVAEIPNICEGYGQSASDSLERNDFSRETDVRLLNSSDDGPRHGLKQVPSRDIDYQGSGGDLIGVVTNGQRVGVDAGRGVAV